MQKVLGKIYRDKKPVLIIGLAFLAVAGIVFFGGSKDEFKDFGGKVAYAAGENPVVVVDLGEDGLDTEDVMKKAEIGIEDPLDKQVGDEFEYDLKQAGEGKYELGLKPKHENLKSGKYSLRAEFVTEGGVRKIDQDFYWGVLALNMNKSIYLPNEEAYLQMGVLDDQGITLCQADLMLQIMDPKGRITTLDTEDGSIVRNDMCGPNNVIESADYWAYYNLGKPGIYQMLLVAETQNGVRALYDYVEVRDNVPFEVERMGPSRIWPMAPYEMKLKIKANEDFQGEVVERVPVEFEILNPKSEILNKFKIQNSNDQKIISWEIDLKAGEIYELGYTFDAPDVSPEFYLVGPLEIKMQDPTNKEQGISNFHPAVAGPISKYSDEGGVIFREARQWQIASDAISFVRSDGTTGTSFSLDIGSAGTDRVVVVMACDESSGTDLSGVTVDGDSCHLVGRAENTVTGANHQEMWYCDEDDLGASNGSVTVAITGGDSGWGTHAHLFTGVSQASTTDFGIDQTSTGTTVTVTGIDVATNGLAVMGACNGSSGTWDSWTSPLDEKQEGPDPSSAVFATANGIETSGASNKTYVATASLDFNRGTGIVAVWPEAVTNNTPTISSVSDTPAQPVTGSSVAFSVDWNDADAGENIKVKICKTDSLTGQNCDGGLWASSTAFTTTDPESVSYTVVSGDAGSTYDYYAFVCDDEAACSASTWGNFSVWWDTTWEYRKKITLDHTAQSTGLQDFPAVATSTSADSDFWGHVQDDYRDLRFIDHHGDEMYFELEDWDYASDDMVVWIKVPFVRATTVDEVFMYYGKSSAATSTYATTTGVWDENFMGVWHMDEVYDSTRNDNWGNNNGAATTTGGWLSDAFDFTASESDYIRVPDDATLDITGAITITAWIYPDGWGSNDYGTMVGKAWEEAYAFRLDGETVEDADDDNLELMADYEAVWANSNDPSVSLSTWQYSVIVYDQSNVDFYVNGADEGGGADSSALGSTAYDLLIGSDWDSAAVENDFDGIIDEVRVSNTNRHVDWVTFEYCNMNGGCNTYGAEEESPAPGVTSVTDTPDPTNPYRSVTFIVDWNDSGDQVKAKVCKTDSLTNQVCDGGFWASSTSFTTTDPESVMYNIIEGDWGQTRDYYVFTCDDSGLCSTSVSGSFSVNNQGTVPNVKFR